MIEKSLPLDLYIHSPFWSARLENLSHPMAIRMAQDLDLKEPLGIGDGSKSFWKGFKHNQGLGDSNVDFLLRIKKKHPQKIILVQIGEFYETWGLDSVFLVEYCGINRMGRFGPRAGMPLANIQSVLDDLTSAGFSIVVCQQADDIHKKNRKIRFISEIITPTSPTYTYGLAMSHKSNICFPEAPPEFGIAVNSKGVLIVEINPDLRTTLVLEGLTIDAAIIRLNKYNGRMNRIFFHEKTPKSLIEAANLKFHNLVRISGYTCRAFPKRMEELIKIDLGFDAHTEFLKTQMLRDKNSPLPLYEQTAQQIGVLQKRGIPDLISLMLPKGSPATCKYIVRNLLLNPPPQNYAQNLRQAITHLQKDNKQLPILIVSNPVRYIKTLNKNEAHPEILKDLFCLAEIFINCQKNLEESFIHDSLELVSYISSIKAKIDILQNTSEKIIKTLKPILPTKEDLPYVPTNNLIPITLFEKIEEEFKGRIAETSSKEVAEFYRKTQIAAQKYEKILTEKLIPIINSDAKTEGKKARKLALSYDIHNHTIWLIGSVNPKIIESHNLIRPIDRYGKEVKDRWTTIEVEDALKEYKKSAKETFESIRQVLKKVSKELSIHCLPIIHLATFSNFVKTIYLHIKECQTKNWTINFENKKSEDEISNEISLEDFFPYWMKSDLAITNSFNFNGTCLLTGHNMSGKSTLIRSLAVTTLLGSIGFMFPAKKLRIAKEIDGWFVRTGANDDPEAGLSAFAVEMIDIKIALRDATKNSFLLIDELGKGTESKAGHAIAASVLEHLAQEKIRSIFATHWHEIFVNPLVNLENIKLIKMHCDDDIPSYKVEDGVDLNSSAFFTALNIGVGESIVKRAQKIAQGYDAFALSNIKNSEANNFVQNDEFSKNISGEITKEIAKKILAILTKNEISSIRNLKENEIPPLSDAGKSFVYIIKTDNNFFYAGETDNFLQRVKAHRNRLSNNKCEFFYASVQLGKSAARKIEQQLITKLKDHGFPMLSINDSENLSFGGL